MTQASIASHTLRLRQQPLEQQPIIHSLMTSAYLSLILPNCYLVKKVNVLMDSTLMAMDTVSQINRVL